MVRRSFLAKYTAFSASLNHSSLDSGAPRADFAGPTHLPLPDNRPVCLDSKTCATVGGILTTFDHEQDMKYAVIIVTYQSEAYIGECIESVRNAFSGKQFEIIVVDNASRDGTCEIVRERFGGDGEQDVRLVANDRNLGFSAANNIGAARTGADTLFFLNPDSIIREFDFAEIERILARPSIGCVGGAVLLDAEKERPFAYDYPHNPLRVFASWVATEIGLAKHNYLVRNYDSRADVFACDWVLGAAMIFPREAYEAVAGFDAGFFLEFEDIDICERLAGRGYAILATRHVRILHMKALSKKTIGATRLNWIRFKSFLHYYAKHSRSLARMLGKQFTPAQQTVPQEDTAAVRR